MAAGWASEVRAVSREDFRHQATAVTHSETVPDASPSVSKVAFCCRLNSHRPSRSLRVTCRMLLFSFLAQGCMMTVAVVEPCRCECAQTHDRRALQVGRQVPVEWGQGLPQACSWLLAGWSRLSAGKWTTSPPQHPGKQASLGHRLSPHRPTWKHKACIKHVKRRWLDSDGCRIGTIGPRSYRLPQSLNSAPAPECDLASLSMCQGAKMPA